MKTIALIQAEIKAAQHRLDTFPQTTATGTALKLAIKNFKEAIEYFNAESHSAGQVAKGYHDKGIFKVRVGERFMQTATDIGAGHKVMSREVSFIKRLLRSNTPKKPKNYPAFEEHAKYHAHFGLHHEKKSVMHLHKGNAAKAERHMIKSMHHYDAHKAYMSAHKETNLVKQISHGISGAHAAHKAETAAVIHQGHKLQKRIEHHTAQEANSESLAAMAHLAGNHNLVRSLRLKAMQHRIAKERYSTALNKYNTKDPDAPHFHYYAGVASRKANKDIDSQELPMEKSVLVTADDFDKEISKYEARLSKFVTDNADALAAEGFFLDESRAPAPKKKRKLTFTPKAELRRQRQAGRKKGPRSTPAAFQPPKKKVAPVAPSKPAAPVHKPGTALVPTHPAPVSKPNRFAKHVNAAHARSRGHRSHFLHLQVHHQNSHHLLMKKQHHGAAHIHFHTAANHFNQGNKLRGTFHMLKGHVHALKAKWHGIRHAFKEKASVDNVIADLKNTAAKNSLGDAVTFAVKDNSILLQLNPDRAAKVRHVLYPILDKAGYTYDVDASKTLRAVFTVKEDSSNRSSGHYLVDDRKAIRMLMEHPHPDMTEVLHDFIKDGVLEDEDRERIPDPNA